VGRGGVALVALALVLAAAVAGAVALARAGGERPPAVVGVLVQRAAGPAERATGFVAAGGRVVTVAHVLDGGGAVMVRTAAGRFPAEVVRTDRAADLALLAVDGLAGAAPAAGSGTRAVVARRAGVRAVPVSVRRRMRARVRDSAGPAIHSRRALELAGDVGGGDSGAPVLAADGELLGVVFARSQRREDVAYAVDAAAVERLLGD
jgi:S1-C subfamily serine protease